MTATVQQIQSELLRIIEIAKREEVIITSDGKAVARLSAVSQPQPDLDRRSWLQNLANLRDELATDKVTANSEQILEDLRSERG